MSFTQITPINTTITPINPDDVPEAGADDFPEDIQTFLTTQPVAIDETRVVIDKQNQMGQDMNTLADEVQEYAEGAKQNISTNVVLMSSYVEVARGASEQAVAAQGGAEVALASTQQAIEDADITGTSGYTMDAVDDKIATLANISFVGLN